MLICFKRMIAMTFLCAPWLLQAPQKAEQEAATAGEKDKARLDAKIEELQKRTLCAGHWLWLNWQSGRFQ